MDIDYRGRAVPALRRRLGTATAAAAVIVAAAAAPAVLAAEVTGVTVSSTAQTYSPAGTPDTIDVAVQFDVPVSVGTPRPVFNLMVGTARRSMAYVDGSGTATLSFEYEVRKGDLDEDGIGWPANALTGGTIRDSDSGELAVRTFPAMARDAEHKVDGVAPRLVSTPLQVTSNPPQRGTYRPGDTIELALEFDEEVSPAETDDSLTLNFDGSERTATRSASAEGVLSFTYTVAAGDEDADGFAVPSARFTVADTHGNVDERTTPALRSAQKVDAVAPELLRTAIVSDPGADRTYGEGDTIVVEVVFDEPVAAAQSTFALLIGSPSTPRTADYLSGDGTNRVRYEYEVAAGDRDADGISYAADALSGTIADRVGNAFDGAVIPVTAQTGHRVDAGEDNEPPVVTGVSVTSSPARADTYDVGQTIEVTVEFNEPVSATSEVALDIVVGNETRQAPFLAPTPADAAATALRFRYEVVAGDVDADGIAVGPIAESLVGGTIMDPTGNTAIRDFAALPAQRRHKVDGLAPVVTGVAVTSDAGADSTYAVGDEIEIRVDFSERVVADHGPELVLNVAVGDEPAAARLAGGERTASLTFRYLVREGDLAPDGISIASTALSGGQVQDIAGNNASDDQAALELDAQPAHKVDAVTTGGTTVAILSSAGSDNTYALGDLIELQVRFAEDVVVSGTVELILSFGANEAVSLPTNLKRRAELVRQTAQRLTFHYRVQAGDLDADGLGVDSNALVGGTVVDAVGNPARLLTPFIDDETTPVHRVDGVEPVVAGIQIVSDPDPDSGDTYGLGEDIEIEVSFTEVVHTNNAPTLVVQIGSQARHAALVDGGGTRTLLFRYTVVSADLDADGISLRSRALSCGDEADFGCITDQAGNDVAEPINGLAAQPRHKVDGRQAEPRLSVADGPQSGNTYGAGERIEIDIDFREPVYVTGGPELILRVGAAQRTASFIRGSATWRLRFGYTVQAGDSDTDGVSIGPGPDALRGGRIVDADDNPVSRVFKGLGPAAGYKVDGNAPAATRAAITSTPENGAYGLGDEIRVAVTFGERVHVRDASDLALILAVGRHSRRATYTKGSGTEGLDPDNIRTTLVFVYRVAADDHDDDGVSIGPDAVVGGIIEDDAGNDWEEADRRIPAVPPSVDQTVNSGIDNRPPKVSDVDFAEPPDNYRTGDVIEVYVMFDEVVHVSGEPTLELSIGPASRQAAFASGSGTGTLQFRYMVVEADTDTDGISIGPGPSSLAGGTIADLAGNPVDRTFRGVPAEDNPKVNSHVGPMVVDIRFVSSPGGDAYRAGEEIKVKVEFSDDVRVGRVDEKPVLVLSIGARHRNADYVSGDGTDTLLFGYTVVDGDYDDDGISIGANALRHHGTIENTEGVPAVRAFRALAANPSQRVDARAAGVEDVEMVQPTSGDTFILGDRIEVRVMFSEAVAVSVDEPPVIGLEIGTQTRRARYVLGSGTDTLVFRYLVQEGDAGDGVSIPDDALPDGAITDLAGNPAMLDLEAVRTDFRFNVDAVLPDVVDIAAVPPESGGTFLRGDEIEVRVVFSEAVTVAGQPTVGLLVGTETRRARLAGGGGTDTLAFRYRVVAGDAGGVGIPANPLSGGTIADIPGNPADRTFEAVPADDLITVDALVPGVDLVEIFTDAGPDLTYTPGDVVEVQATFTDAVHVTGEPVLTLSIGANSRPAAYATGSGTDVLLFQYTVVDGDYDEDGISIAANALTGGTIADASGNPVDRGFGAVPAQSDHRVGAETTLLLPTITLRVGAPLVSENVFRAYGITYDGPLEVASDNPAVATASTTGTDLTVTPVSEGTANIAIFALRAPITLVLPVTVEASEAETAVLQSALAAIGRGLLGTAADTIGARLELAHMPTGRGAYRANYGGTSAMPSAGHPADPRPSARDAGTGMFGMAGGFVGHGDGGPAEPRSYRPTSFAIPLAGGMNATTSWGAWGAAAYQAFEGTPDAGSYDGDLTSFHLGADARTDGWVAGASVSRAQASVAYAFDGDASGAGTLDTELTALHPYVQWRPGPGTTVWTILGFGAGEATAQRAGQSVVGEPATLGMRLGLAGLRVDLGRPGGVALALRGDAGFVQLETEDGVRAVDGLSVQAQRVRAGVEASRPVSTAAGILSPFVELGARWDGGDGAAGGGVEVAGGIRYRGPGGGFEVKARTLAMHGADGVAEHGIAATAFIEPGAGGTGLRLSLTPRWGAPESRDVFWQSDYALRGPRPEVRDRHWMLDGQIGYGLALRGRPGALEPFVAVGGSPGADSRARLGVRYGSGGHGGSRYEVSGERVEGGGRVDNRLLLVAEARF